MAFDDSQGAGGGGGGGGDNSADIAAVIWFLFGAGLTGDIHMGYRARESFDAFARLVGEDPDDLWRRMDEKSGKL
jgi:hypothetical protein